MAIRTILLDVGGTFIKCSDGREIPMDSAGSREDIVSSLNQAVSGYQALVAAVPGPFNYSTGEFRMTHKFAAVFGEYFADLVGLPRENCRFEHDVNAMLCGELPLYPSKNVALVTLGTGLGFGMYVDGAVQRNALGSPAVPIYNLPFRDGILEDYVSKRGFLRGYESAGITVKQLSVFAHQGDTAALARFEECAQILSDSIAPILRRNRIQVLLFGGQISRSFDLMKEVLSAKLPFLEHVGAVSDIDNATFNGLKNLK